MTGLLREQEDVSSQRAMPVSRVDASFSVTSVTGETVTLQYYNAGVQTADAGQVAGTAVIGKLAYAPVLDTIGSKVANDGNTSLSFTCLAFTNERPFPFDFYEGKFNGTALELLTGVTAGFANGDYCVDYRTGTIYGVKATTASTMTSVAYKRPTSTATIDVGDIEIGAVELKDGTTDARATINAANTARTSATTVVAVQPLDETGAIIKGGGASVTAQYISPTDFTATYTSSSTLTLTGLPYTLTSGVQIVYVKVRNTSTNLTTTYVAGSNNYGFGYSAGVVTIYLNGVAITALTTYDTYEVGINGQEKAYDPTVDVTKTIDQSPLSAKYVIDSLVDTTNSSGTVYYPSSTGMSMDGYRSASFSGKFIDADNTTTMTIEALNDEDTTSGDWQDVTQCFNNDKAGVATSIGASIVATSATTNFAISREDFNYSYFRVKVVYGDATNTSIIKLRRKAM